MVRYLIYRPIGTSVVALTLMILGIIAIGFLPVSLLPDIPVPEITVQVTYPNADARQIQRIIALPLRNQLLQLNHLDNLEVISNDGQAVIKIRFDYNTNIDLAYLEANEKIDMLLETLPRDMERPKVIKAGAGDISVFQLNVRQKDSTGKFLELSSFCENILKRRLEQLPEIAFVDMTGLARAEVSILPNMVSLKHTGLTTKDLSELIQSQSGELGNVTIKDGPYEYSIRFEATLRSVKDIENLYFKIGQDNFRLIRLGDVANVSIKEQKRDGLYSFNGQRAIGMAVIKQTDAQLLHLRKEMKALVSIFEKDYPSLNFHLSQDQTELLDLSINNLINSLLVGAVLSFFMIFLFMKDKRILLLIGLVIPISLTVTLLGFYVIGISINIVSLAGLVLGIGEIIDSAIIIIENIEDQRREAKINNEYTLAESCIAGSEEVIRPLFTSVLTNSAVFLPLLFLSGIAGALFFDQAIAVSLALGVSLLTSYTLIPVLYFLVFKKQKQFETSQTRASVLVEHLYERLFNLAFKRPGMMMSFWGLLLISVVWIFANIEKTGMPNISRTELETYINWNEPVSSEESYKRLNNLNKHFNTKIKESGLFVGHQQFLLNERLQQSSTEAVMIMKVSSPDAYDSLKREIQKGLKSRYPNAIFESRPSLNVFEQLFRTTEPPLRVLISAKGSQSPPNLKIIDSTAAILESAGEQVQLPPRRNRIQIRFAADKLLLYSISPELLINTLRTALNDNSIGTLHSEQQLTPISIGNSSSTSGLKEIINNLFVTNNDGTFIPVRELISFTSSEDYASLFLGKEGSYVPLVPQIKNIPLQEQRQIIENIVSHIPSLTATFEGSYYRNLSYIEDLSGIIVIAIGMLFFILAAQFESLQQPFIVLMTILFGASGAFVWLYVADSSLNIMSAIGLIVLIGLLDNDSILKMDTMNKTRDKYSLMEVIKMGGKKRLQSQIMTFLTTELGLLPILWSSGLGAELQKPLALVVIGGMIIGVLISWTFIPLTYYWLYKKQS